MVTSMKMTYSTVQAKFRPVARNRFELYIVCPNCAACGEARMSEGPNFRVAAYPPGFAEMHASSFRHETKVRCNCGQEFYLL